MARTVRREVGRHQVPVCRLPASDDEIRDRACVGHGGTPDAEFGRPDGVRFGHLGRFHYNPASASRLDDRVSHEASSTEPPL